MTTSFLFRLACPLPRLLGWLAAALLLPVTASRAQLPTPPEAAATPEAADAGARAKMTENIVRGFHPKQGTVTLPDGTATLNVPEGFCYLDANDSRQLLVDLWRNPPTAAEGVLGMILTTQENVPNVRNWAVVITYENRGYVKDSDSDTTDYAAALKQMQEATHANNARRQQAGYPPIELVGWAAPPRYDKANKKIYWAKELQFGDNAEHTLNYDVRILGRQGLAEPQRHRRDGPAPRNRAGDAENPFGMVNFNQGHRYTDFNPKTDKDGRDTGWRRWWRAVCC